jgi:hypothetical protein
MVRRPALASLSLLVLAATFLSLALGGCYTNDAVDPDDDSPGSPPILAAEPPFSPGLANTVSWSVSTEGKNGSPAGEFLVQRSSDPLFEQSVEESGWITDLTYEFTGLEHGSTHHYRVLGRNPQAKETAWSTHQTSTQDALPPVATLTELGEEQTSLLFILELSGTDETSGIQEIELWFRVEDGEPTLYGTFPPGEASFQATGGGRHEFFPVAIDGAGNRQERDPEPLGFTQVPEPIIITDSRGEEFDITASVLEYNMAEQYWEHGLGRFTIRPIIDPRMLAPGDIGYPLPNHLTEVCGVKFNDDTRAYKIHDLPHREVVDDVVGGVPIAVCY